MFEKCQIGTYILLGRYLYSVSYGTSILLGRYMYSVSYVFKYDQDTSHVYTDWLGSMMC